MTTKELKALDKLIEREYYKQGDGKCIDIMLIGKLFADARRDVLSGKPVAEAVKAAIDIYCMEVA